MTKIRPVVYPLGKGTATKIAVLVEPFYALANSCNLGWYLYSDDNIILDSGQVQLTEEEYAEWADDNNFIIDIVLDELGLVRA